MRREQPQPSTLSGQPLSNKTTDLWQHITEAEFEFFMKFKATTARRTPTIGFLKKSMTACQNSLILRTVVIPTKF
jgi:hypothetical protein